MFVEEVLSMQQIEIELKSAYLIASLVDPMQTHDADVNILLPFFINIDRNGDNEQISRTNTNASHLLCLTTALDDEATYPNGSIFWLRENRDDLQCNTVSMRCERYIVYSSSRNEHDK